MLTPPSPRAEAALRFGAFGAVGTLVGVVLSGPAAVVLVNSIHPQPPWQDASVFVRNYHGVQLLPYVGGITLVAALVALLSALSALAPEERSSSTRAALVFGAVFAALVFFNYVVQTTFLPALAGDYRTEDAAIVAAFSMSNPKSLAWGIEMWGWGFLGVATWLIAPVFGGTRLERTTAFAFIANGPVSLVGAAWTIFRPGWVMSPAGLIAFALWNVLLAAMAALALVALRRRQSSGLPREEPSQK